MQLSARERNTEFFDALNRLPKENSSQSVDVDSSNEYIGKTRRTLLRQATQRRGLTVHVSEMVLQKTIAVRARS